MKNSKLRILLAASALVLAACGPKSSLPAYLDGGKDIETRVEDALGRLSLEEKVAMLHAQSKFSSKGVPRLGIPEIWCDDGPHGVRPETFWDQWRSAEWTNDSCTAFPALTALAATWNPELSELYGRSVGEEARYRGKSVLLGPGVNICRSPLNGRNFEYFGEDPFLASEMVVPYVQGIQQNGVAACVKHYALNNQETWRHNVDVVVDDRTLYEIYLPAFKAAVQRGGAWSVMGAYNLYQGQFATHNRVLVNEILKGEWGFDGVVISDWGAAESTDDAVRCGLDLEFGTHTDGLSSGGAAYDSYYLAKPYLEGLRSGKYDMDGLDDKVRRILRLQFRTNMAPNRPWGRFTCDEHYDAARRIGAEGIVLLKNEGGLLPVDPARYKKILVVGENAYKMLTLGGGSSSLKVQHEITPLQGIRERFEGLAEVRWERGYVGDTTSHYNNCWTGQDLTDGRSPEQLVADAAAAARESDLVIFVGGLNKKKGNDAEGRDRQTMALPYGQDALIEALAEANPALVVVNISGAAVAMPWADKVPAILQDWYLGSEAGRSLADVLSGDVNPSGKLPFTIPYALEDGPLRSERQFPGVEVPHPDVARGVKKHEQEYSEGVFVGYRWFEAQEIPVRWPFGYGLSYTQFEYGPVRLSSDAMRAGGSVRLSVAVTNKGTRAGAETVQLYVADKEASVPRPVKELKGFRKVFLSPGQTVDVSFTVTADALSWFDAGAHAWRAEAGEFELLVGASSQDIRGRASFTLREERELQVKAAAKI